MSRGAKAAIVVAFVAITGAALVSLYSDLGTVASTLRTFPLMALGAAMGLALCNYGIRFGRWQLYLRAQGHAVPPGQSLGVFLSGFALSITPGKIGEVVKSYLLRSLVGIPIAQSAPIVVVERITDLIALVLIAAAGVWLYGAFQSLVVAVVLLLAAGLVILAWPSLCRGLIDFSTRPRPLEKLREPLHRFYNGLFALSRPWPLTWATVLAIAAWLMECIGFAVILAAFPGANVPFGLAAVIYCVTTLAGAVSFLPGGLLVTEATMTVFLVESGHGVSEAIAVAATLLTRLATLWFAVLLGVVALALLRRRYRRVESALAEAEANSGKPS